jgi:ATP-dependent helicase HrpB
LIRLPVDDALPELRAALERSPNAVLEAPPGAGKTTRVPPALLPLLADGREVLVLEPRRLAARLAARRVAEELGEPLGGTVGYQVRFDEVSSARTRIRFLTEGVLTRRLLSDPLLERAGLVILDEFHERHLDGDLALALLLRLQQTQRPDLRVLVMSATLDGQAIARHLGDCPRVRSEGRLFDTALHYTPASADPLARQVARALEGLLARGPLPGDALVFLPGAREIRESMEACGPLLHKHGILSLPLSGDLSPEEQDRAVQPAGRPKVIFSTNVAESSVTIEGVRLVIDSGLARIAEDSPWTGLPSLHIKRIAQSSARQRAGRAARQGPGTVVRLYTAEDFARRPAQDTPEVMRRELAQLLLDLRVALARPAAGLRDRRRPRAARQAGRPW